MSSTHLSRKDLKQDAVAAALEQPVEYVAHHKTLVTRIAIGVVAAIVIFGGYQVYSSQQASAREEALRVARRELNATVGGEARPPAKSYPTEAEKQKAVVAAFTKVADEYPGTTEAAIALNYVAGVRIDEGDVDAAAAIYRQIVDNAPQEFQSTAKLALAQIVWGQGKQDEAKSMLQELMDSPTIFVSAAQAKLVLARLYVENNQEDEARKLLDTIGDADGAARAAAIEMLGRMAQETAAKN